MPLRRIVEAMPAPSKACRIDLTMAGSGTDLSSSKLQIVNTLTLAARAKSAAVQPSKPHAARH